MVEKTIGEVLKQGVDILKRSGIENPLLDSQLILCRHLCVDKLHVITKINQNVSEEVEKLFLNDILKRAKHMPVQYILGTQEFMSMNFKVNENTLIPRPDTEILVEEIINSVNQDEAYYILDIGTGSGCITISLAKYIKNAVLHSVDISQGALEVARENARLNQVEEKIEFYIGNLFEPFSNCDIKFDIIVSNPPYIPSKVVEGLDSNVKDYEPRTALDGGEDGLDFYREIIREAPEFLKEKGMIFFEIGFDQAEDLKGLLENSNFTDIRIVKDLAGLHRVVRARL